VASPGSRRLYPFSSTAVSHVGIPKQQCRGCSYAAAESYLVSFNNPRSTGASPLHAPCHRCSDVTTTCPGLGANDIICCLVIFCQQQTTNVCQSCHPHSPKYCYHPDPDITLFLITLTEHQSMIYMKLQTVSLPATVNSTRSHVAKGFN
jgi:hypothetical protein